MSFEYQEVSKNKKILQSVLDHIGAIIYVIDFETHELLFANKTLRDFYSDISFSGKKCWEILRPDYGGKQCDICMNYKLEGKPVGASHSHDVYNEIQDKWYFVEETLLEWLEGQRVILMICLDITERKKAELALEQKNKELLLAQKDLHTAEGMVEREREASQLKSRFLANMSHEIRTPMNAILGFSSLALQNMPSSADLEAFKKINNAANNMLSIVNDILEFTRIEEVKVKLTYQAFLLEKAVRNTLYVAEERIKNNEVVLNFDIDSEIPDCLYGDKARIEQIIRNVLENSAKYTKRGSINFKVTHKPESEVKTVICFEVSDTGIGMSEKSLENMFIRFEKSENEYNVGGTGLGMSIVKQLLDLMGGNIEVSSKEGEGTRVYFEIPLEITKENIDAGEKEAEYKKFTDARVLLVEDNPINQEVAGGILELFGIRVEIAENGKECIDMLKQKPYDLVFMDILMPIMDGYSTTNAIRKSGKPYQNIPIVAMTANVLPEQKEKCFEEGMDGHIGKPLDANHIYSYLVQFLER